jgi:hypothetical protein
MFILRLSRTIIGFLLFAVLVLLVLLMTSVRISGAV